MTYIYALIDPRTNEIRYVGKSDNPEKRLKGHIKEANKKNCNHYKCNWIRELLRENLQPSIMILEECENIKSMWEERECYWIKYYRETGYDLTNLTDGGEGMTDPTGEISQKISDALKEYWETSPNAKERQSKRMKEREIKAHCEESNKKRRIAALKWWENHPEAHEKQRISLLKFYEEHPEAREERSKEMLGKKRSTESIAKQREFYRKRREQQDK